MFSVIISPDPYLRFFSVSYNVMSALSDRVELIRYLDRALRAALMPLLSHP